MTEIKAVKPADETRSLTTDMLLWFGFFGAAIAWTAHLMLVYLIAEFGCVSPFHAYRWWGFSGVAWLIGGVSIVTLGLAIAAWIVAWRNNFRFAGEVEAGRVEPYDTRVFLARSGVITSSLFILIIVVETIPILFYLQGC